MCSNYRYSWVTYFILSNFCNFSQFVYSNHPLLLYYFLSPYQSFVVLSNFCHRLTLCYLLIFYLIYAPYKCTCCAHHKHNSLSCLVMRTLSAPIYLTNSPAVFGQSAILIWGDRDMAGGFHEEQPDTLQMVFFKVLKIPSKDFVKKVMRMKELAIATFWNSVNYIPLIIALIFLLTACLYPFPLRLGPS